MAKTNLRSFNLNSLPILREVLRHGNLTKAAAALNVSQPALSATLKRLRAQFDDELIVRSGAQAKLTPKGESLLAPLEQALRSVETFLGENEEDSAPMPRLQIATTDHIMHVFGLGLARMSAAKNSAPSFQFLNVGLHSVPQLVSGVIDAVIIPRVTMMTGLAAARSLEQVSSESLFTERLVCLARKDDASAHEDMSVANYLERPHASFASDPTFAITTESQFLAAQGLDQNDVIRMATYGALPAIVAEMGCLAAVPESFAHRATRFYPLKSFSPPLDFPAMEWVMIWHKLHGASPAHDANRMFLKARSAELKGLEFAE